MEVSEILSYVFSIICAGIGFLIMWGEEAYLVPASGSSLRIPCAFLFWVMAVIFWAMAVVIDDEDENL